MGRPKKELPNRAAGLYEIKITYGKDFKTGKPLRKSFYSSISKSDAKSRSEEWKMDYEMSQRNNQTFVTRDISFERWSIKWLEIYKKGKVKEHTYKYTYRTNIENYMIPFFGNAKLVDISQTDIQRYFNEHRHLAESSLKRHHIILSAIFEQAIYNDLCTKNPVKGIQYTSIKPPAEKNVYTSAQSFIVEQYCCEAGDEGLPIYVILGTGMRRSEVLGLKWSDIDFVNKMVSVKRAVVPDTIELRDGDVKSKTSYRSIPVSQEFLDHVSKFKYNSDFVIAGEGDSFRTIDSFDFRYKAFMKKMSSKKDIPYLSPHELRHSYGSILREKGVDIYTISKVMGHSDISITAQIYVHNDLEVLRKNMKL